MQKVDIAELRRLHEAAMQETSTPQDLRKSMNAAYLALPALLDELEAAREKVRLQALVIDELPEEVAGLHAVIELQREMIAHKDALAATPAQSLAAHDAALLREVAKKQVYAEPHPVNDYVSRWLLAEADRIEKEATNG